MINTEFVHIPAYTTREFMNFGLYKAHTYYNFKYTPSENNLLRTGAIKLFPDDMLNYTALKEFKLGDKDYKPNDIVDTSSCDENTKKVLIKNRLISCNLKDDYSDKTLAITKALLYDYVGKSFKKTSEDLNLDFEKVKETFELKQGANTKKIKQTDLDKLLTLIEV